MAHGDEVEQVMPSVLRWLVDWCMLCKAADTDNE